MKKKLLFVIPDLQAGGAEKSLVNLLNEINPEKYEIDLFLFSKSGLFFDQVPEHVTLLDPNLDFETFLKPLPSSLFDYLKKRRFRMAKNRLDFSRINRKTENIAIAEQKSWVKMASSIKPLDKKYDVAIAYLEKSPVYFVADFVNAEKKIAWIHTDYHTSGLNPEFDRPIFEQMDFLVTISDSCKQSLEIHFPNIKTKIVENITSKKLIEKLACQSIACQTRHDLELLTIARISEEKGIDIAVEAAKNLRARGLDFCWRVIGDGPQRSYIEKMINDYGLQDNFKLLGLKSNPYSWIKNADIYVQPSRYEGRSIAIDEAMLLGRPIVVTNFSTVKDQITDGVTGVIAAVNSDSIAEKIFLLSQNREQMKNLSDNLRSFSDRTDEIMDIFHSLF